MGTDEGLIQNKLLLTITAIGAISAYFAEIRAAIAFDTLKAIIDIVFAISGALFLLYLLLIFTRYTSGGYRYKLPLHFDPALQIELDPKKVDALYDWGVRLFSIILFASIPLIIIDISRVVFTEIWGWSRTVSDITAIIIAGLIGLLLFEVVKQIFGKKVRRNYP